MLSSLLRSLLPFLNWPRPTAASLRKDAWAGLSVALVLIPQSLAYATLAGMPPQTGLYAAMLPAVVGILWGSSALLAVGPVALTSLLTTAVLLPLASPGGSQWVSLAIWLAIYSGLIQLVLGLLRLGAIAHVVSDSVITGFINAAAMIIILSQIPPLLGLPPMAFDLNWPGEALAMLRASPMPVLLTAAFGLGALALLKLQRRFAARLPGVLLVCIGGIVVSALGGLAEYGIHIVGAIPRGVPALQAPPHITSSQHLTLLSAALIIALISFTEAMSSCRILSKKFKTPWSENQELIGQGLAKIASGFSGAFPVSGSFSRSALNAYVGATSGWSALFASVCIFVCLLWATDYLFHLPRAILAAIIIVPVMGLIDLRAMGRSVRHRPAEGLVAVATFIATLASTPALHWGVLAGLVASFFGLAYKVARPRIAELGLDDAGMLRDGVLDDLRPIAPDVLAVRMESMLVCATVPRLERFILERVRPQVGIRTVLVCCAAIPWSDAAGRRGLCRLREALAAMGVALSLSAPKGKLGHCLSEAGNPAAGRTCTVYSSDDEAVTALGDQPRV